MGAGSVNACKVVFNEIDCCSIVHAFINNSKLTQAWIKVVSYKKLKLFSDILVGTKRIEFYIPAELADIYQSYVDSALSAMTSGSSAKLLCRHKPADHEKALCGLKLRLKRAVSISA